MDNGIALLGTSADPPTRGHQALLTGLLGRYEQVGTWASDNPMKSHGAPLALRARLLKALVEQIKSPGLTLEQELSSPWALTTLQRAALHWPMRDLVFVVGSDLAAQIPRWRKADEFLQLCRLAIAPRKGWPLLPGTLRSLEQLGARIELLDLAVPASASSELRQAPQQSQVPSQVWPLLIEHGLYGLTPSRR
jgi:nicotinate-nucleotide adenylyltransferase